MSQNSAGINFEIKAKQKKEKFPCFLLFVKPSPAGYSGTNKPIFTGLLAKHSIKGALDNFSHIPQVFFIKVEIIVPLEVYTCVATACLILLATST